MKKAFKKYIIIWFLLFIVFNVCTFLIPLFNGETKINNNFFVGYGIIVITFIIELFCGYMILNVNTINKIFINLPMAYIGYGSLWIVGIIGILSMTVPGYPIWLSIVLGVIVICFLIALIVVTLAGINYINKVDNKIEDKIILMKESEKIVKYLYDLVEDGEIKKELKMLFENIKYSDSILKNNIKKIEIEIYENIKKLQLSIEQKRTSEIKYKIKEIISLIKKRKVYEEETNEKINM